ncbi:MAG: hypothetical protein DHS20C07_14830 [Methyloligella sp.]|nr:MAG: hypothetical protein DHS20C07_14830 [Methyloligella sp.]
MKQLMRNSSIFRLIVKFVIIVCFSTPVFAGGADVVDGEITKDSNGRYTVIATIKHNDEGMDHFANHLQVLTPDGKVIGAMYFVEPKVHEQPFVTIVQSVKVPSGVRELRIRAHDKVHGYTGKEFKLKVPE